MNSYFGTSLPALGGILVLGALPRIKRQARLHDALLMGLGLAILANTRPYEGLVFSLPFAGATIVWMYKQRRIPKSLVFRNILLPLMLVLTATGCAMGYYFWRVTGNTLVMPYQVNRQTYAVAPYFIWQKPRPEPVYRHAEMQNFYVNWELRSYEEGTTFLGFARRLANRAGMLWVFFVGPIFTLPLLAFPWLFRDRKMRLPLIAAATVLAGNVVETWTFDHYLAPAVGLFFLLITQCIRHLRLYKLRGRPIGQGLARAVVLVCISMVILRVVAMATGARIEPARQLEENQKRTIVTKELRAKPGNQLVIVHYGRNHVPHEDWINNRADIDASKIVWARDMGDAQNLELLLYFKDRRAWRIDADDPAPTLEPYSLAPYSPASN